MCAKISSYMKMLEIMNVHVKIKCNLFWNEIRSNEFRVAGN
jgi:hypothetical protein